VVYRVASTSMIMSRGQQVPRGTVHAYLEGRQTTICGREIGSDLVGFESMRWSARPLGLATCPICFKTAR